MTTNTKVPAKGRTLDVIAGIDLPQLVEGDILINYPRSPSPRKELVIAAEHWYGSSQQLFTTLHFNEENAEIRSYGLYRCPIWSVIKINKSHKDFEKYYERAVIAGLI
ncbi:hypothetical protein HYV89_01405 [Candidatus Woesearchaeota archaeon]|nr:hypothetical protein [Candidatus Woesearchaeota archaeon]